MDLGDEAARPLLLPEKTRLFYIGPMKTGTTSVQEAAKAARSTMYDYGVYYPGKGRNHRRAVNAFLRRPDSIIGGPMRPGATRPEVQTTLPTAEWDELMADIDTEESRRIFVSHEFAASASDEQASNFVESLGTENTHILMTLRPLSALLPSHWTQSLKGGESRTFDAWLEKVFDSDNPLDPDHLQRQLNQAALVERWASVVGPENVTVVITDTNCKNLSTRTIEQMLGLPEQTLTGAMTGGRLSNRSMSFSEAEVFRRLNKTLYSPDTLSWHVYREIIRQGAIHQILDSRNVDAAEPRVQIPHWAAEISASVGKKTADLIETSGVRVVGDLETLRSESPGLESVPPLDESVPTDIAVEALAGAVYGAMRYERKLAKRMTRLDKQQRRYAAELKTAKTKMKQDRTQTLSDRVRQVPAAEKPQRAAEALTTRNLLSALRIRLTHKFRTGKSMPIR